MRQLSQSAIDTFQAAVWQYYAEHGRHDLPWRQPETNGRFDPYKIFVSELMLQQTQVSRVVPKYETFLRQFPTVAALASVELGDVLRAWNGLGYNRRAKYLWQTARILQERTGGQLPNTTAELVKFPGIGRNTAGAIVAYAYNKPAIFIETNIRTVYIHQYFADRSEVSDTDITAALEMTLPPSQYREWYWALMDYGSFLKQTTGNLNMLSKTYVKQAPFVGSKRQIRGAVLRRLAAGPATYEQLQHHIASPVLEEVLQALRNEGLIRYTKMTYYL